MSSDDAFTLSTMIISDDENDYHELNQAEQIQQVAKQERKIREAKKRKQAQRRKWFRMILLFHRKNVIKESKRFEKHKQNLINQCIELTSNTFMTKTIFNQTDIDIASKSIPSILPIRVLKNRPHFVVNTTKKIDRSANNAAYTLDIKTPLLSLWPQALDTLSPVINLGISIPPLPNKISDADNAAPGAALNALPTVPPYTPKQAVSPLLDFIPVDYSLRREQRPYTAAAKAVEALFAERENEKQIPKTRSRSNKASNTNQLPLFFHPKDLIFLKQSVADEFEELRNLEFAYHENDDDNIDNIDEYSSKSSEEEKPKVKYVNRPKQVKIIKQTKQREIKEENPKSHLLTDYSDTEEEERAAEEEKDVKAEQEDFPEKEEEEQMENNKIPANFVFDDTEIKNIINLKCLEFIDGVVYKAVAKSRINTNTLETAIVTKPLRNFSEYFNKEVLPNYPSSAMDRCNFDFLNAKMDRSLEKFLKQLLLPKEAKEIRSRKDKSDRHKRKHHRHHRHNDGKDLMDIHDQSDDEAIIQAEA
ncbi:hypothetical protein M9Y10_000069 [Tritrichomonas musculus]|uniref:Uncharacterized protein n=1 Tax=Tritrichomonas musculus TaxID=1915356 RepID=A0ABR2L4C8_9EUKA